MILSFEEEKEALDIINLIFKEKRIILIFTILM